MDGIDHRCRIVGGDELVAVRAIYCGGADFRGDDRDLLVHVVLVGVLSDEGTALVVQLLVDRDGLTGMLISLGNINGNDLETARLLSREGVLRHILGQQFTVLGIVQLRDQLVIATGEEVGVGHLVLNREEVTHADVRVTIHRVVCLGGDGGLHVGEGAEVVHLAVAAHDDRCLDELIALVCSAAQLLDEVGVVGQCALGVIRRGAAEPDACGGVQLGAVDDTLGIQRPVVGVGLMGVLVPRGGGGEIAVLIRHDNMALAGGLGGELEGYSGEAVLAVIALLGELKVAAHDLILERAVEGVHQHAVLGDAELMRLAVGEQIALTRLDLLNGVETEGQQMSTGACLAVLDGEGRDDLPLVVGHAVGDDRVLVERLHLELRAVDAGRADGVAGAVLDVVLGDFHAAAHDVILCGEGVDLAVLGDGGVHLIGGVEVAVVRGGLADDVVAIGQSIVAGGGESLVIGLDDLDGLALGVSLAVHLHGVLVVVDDGEADAFKGSITLRGLAGLGVELLDGHTAANHHLRDFRSVESNDSVKGLLLNLLEIHVGVQLVTDGSLGLVDSNRTTGNRNDTILIEKLVTRHK